MDLIIEPINIGPFRAQKLPLSCSAHNNQREQGLIFGIRWEAVGSGTPLRFEAVGSGTGSGTPLRF